MAFRARFSATHPWLLTASERNNPSSVVDRPHGGEQAWSTGNHVEALTHGAVYFRRLRAELAACRAGDQVFFVSWRGDPAEQLDGPGTAIAVELARAVSAGVRVHGLIWRSHLDWLNRHARDNRDFVKMLQALGASAVLDQRVRAAGSHHQKFVVIRRRDTPDSDVAFVGGIDLSYSRRDTSDHRGDPQPVLQMAAVYGPRPAWHDTHLEIRGPAVTDVERCFRERWQDPTALQHLPWLWLYDKLPTGQRFDSRLPPELPRPGSRGSHTVQLLRTYPAKTPRYPFAPRGEFSVARGYIKALARSRELVYVEDQFLWSPMVARVFASALRANPRLRIVAVVPHHPDSDSRVQVAGDNVAHRRALDILYAAGGDRVDLYELENSRGTPVYVHSKVCIVDDTWAAVGSANANRRSWTHDSELTAAVVDDLNERETRDSSPPEASFARDLRLRLWREHLDRAEDDHHDLLDPDQGAAALRKAATELDYWHAHGDDTQRPPGRLRTHPTPVIARSRRWWARWVSRLLLDPDGRPRQLPWRT